MNCKAAEATVAAARAEYLPSARADRLLWRNDQRSGATSVNWPIARSFTAGATVSVPLFTGGLNRSRVRPGVGARQRRPDRRRGRAPHACLQNVSSAYAQMLSTARHARQPAQKAVRAASVAAEGVRQEAQVGLRTTLDVLNQELELRNAQTDAGQRPRRNEYVAQRFSCWPPWASLDGPNAQPDDRRL
ncbi:MAG: hypothetical protein ACWGHP_10630 [Stenotrophomonas sp.]